MAGLTVVGTLARPGPQAIGVLDGFPPAGLDRTTRASRFVLAPHSTVEILLGLKSDDDGTSSFDGVAVTYSWHDASYRVTFPLSMRICSPANRYVGRGACPSLLSSPSP